MMRPHGRKTTHHTQFVGNESVTRHVSTQCKKVIVATKSQHCLVTATMKKTRIGPQKTNVTISETNGTEDAEAA